MMNFQGTNLIVKVGKSIYQLDRIEDLTETVLGKQYGQLTEKKKFLKRYESILPFSIQNKKMIVYSPKGVVKADGSFDNTTRYDIGDSLLIDDELTYFLSLCKLNQLQILEQRDANIFTANMNKSQMKGNYVAVNKFADELLKSHIKGVVTEEKTTDERY